MNPPDQVSTERLLLRRWARCDAVALKAAIDASLAHLQAWMVWAIAEPTPLPELQTRLARHETDFDAGRAWLYGIFSRRNGALLGGIGLHPHTSPSSSAVDHVEIGYWLRADATGQGYAAEAAKAAVDAASALPGIARVEIRCDPNNIRSANVPRRLGFRYAQTIPHHTVTPRGAPRDTVIWEWPVRQRAPDV